MRNQDVGIIRDSGIVAALSVGDAIAHKHRNTVELIAIYFDAGVAEIVYVGIESVDVGTVKAVVMISADEYLVAIWKVAKPVHEVYGLGFTPGHREVSRVYNDIGLWHIPKPAVATVRIR